MHKINKEYNEQHNFWVLTCSEGCKITDWNEGDDIMTYSSFTVAYCPQNADLNIYHCVSIEEDERLLAEQELMIKKHEEEER